MVSPLEGSLARQIHKGMLGLFLDATLTRDVAGVSSPDTERFDPPEPTQDTYACKGIVEVYNKAYRTDGLILQNDRKVLVLAGSLSTTPLPGDRVTIQSVTFTAIAIETDPATAVWVIQGRM